MQTKHDPGLITCLKMHRKRGVGLLDNNTHAVIKNENSKLFASLFISSISSQHTKLMCDQTSQSTVEQASQIMSSDEQIGDSNSRPHV